MISHDFYSHLIMAVIKLLGFSIHLPIKPTDERDLESRTAFCKLITLGFIEICTEIHMESNVEFLDQCEILTYIQNVVCLL